ncbi:MAG: NUDIX domain-containing protein [Treponema sp.]
MKHIKLINDDYRGYSDIIRHACRGILIHDNRILLCYEANNDKYIIPGGGIEEGETLEQCCEREILEETGIAVTVRHRYLEIEELFDVWNHFNHYFLCNIRAETGKQHLTEGEKQAGYTYVWLPLEEALDIFGNYERYRTIDLAKYGLYRREFTALTECVSGT